MCGRSIRFRCCWNAVFRAALMQDMTLADRGVGGASGVATLRSALVMWVRQLHTKLTSHAYNKLRNVT
jgi:hypothetical protein